MPTTTVTPDAARDVVAVTRDSATVVPSVHLKAHDTGTLASALDAAHAPAGTFAVIDSAASVLACRLYSGLGGATATVEPTAFVVEPALNKHVPPGGRPVFQDYFYSDALTGPLWKGDPRAEDVAQGYLNDCFVFAAMGAVAAANPAAIKRLFAPATDGAAAYQVTLHARGTGGARAPHAIAVDTRLPVGLAASQIPVYGLCGRDLSARDVPLWPALVEKALAASGGGYLKLDAGGFAGQAMEALTGEKSTSEVIAPVDADLLAGFKQWKASGAAVVCGTLGSRSARDHGGFSGTGDGPYRVRFGAEDDSTAEIVHGTLTIHSKSGAAAVVLGTDDGQGQLTGAAIATSAIDYDHGTVEVTFKPGHAQSAADLLADYEWRGLLDATLVVYAYHFYIFDSVDGAGNLVLKNPWGDTHPHPIAPADFRRLFDSIYTNPVPR